MIRATSSIFLICLFAVTSSMARADATNCAVIAVNKTAFFNLCPFAQIDPFYINDNDTGFSVNFTLANARQKSCDKTIDVWAIKEDTAGDDCEDIAVDSPAVSLLDINDENSGIAITFPPNAASLDEQNRSLIVWLYCNKSATNVSGTDFLNISATTDQILIQGTSSYACPYITLSKLLNFLEDNKYPFIGASILLGLFICFFGLRLFNYTIFIITATATTLGSGMLFFEFTKFGTQQWVLWLIFGTCVIVGCILGYLTIVYEKLGFFALGAGLGVVGGFFIYNTILSQFIEGHTFVVYLVVAVCALVGGGLALWLWKDIIIIASSIIGAYMVIRAISILIGGFPNEISVATGVAKLGVYAYIYLAVILLVSLVGMYYQFREKRLREEEEGDEDEYLKADRD